MARNSVQFPLAPPTFMTKTKHKAVSLSPLLRAQERNAASININEALYADGAEKGGREPQLCVLRGDTPFAARKERGTVLY